MEKLKRYDIKITTGGWRQHYTKDIESTTGRYYLADDVDAREEARKMTLEQLRAQFEKTFYGFNYAKYISTGDYSDENTHRAFYIYEQCARKNNLLKDGE